MLNLTAVFCTVADFCQKFMPEFEEKLLSSLTRKRNNLTGCLRRKLCQYVFINLGIGILKAIYIRYVKKLLINIFQSWLTMIVLLKCSSL